MREHKGAAAAATTKLPFKCGHRPSTLTKPGLSTGARAKEVGCYVRHDTQDPTRATVASNCSPRIKSCDTDSTTEGNRTGGSKAQEQD